MSGHQHQGGAEVEIFVPDPDHIRLQFKFHLGGGWAYADLTAVEAQRMATEILARLTSTPPDDGDTQ